MYLCNLTHCKNSKDVEQINMSLNKSIKVSYELISSYFSITISWIPVPPTPIGSNKVLFCAGSSDLGPEWRWVCRATHRGNGSFCPPDCHAVEQAAAAVLHFGRDKRDI